MSLLVGITGVQGASWGHRPPLVTGDKQSKVTPAGEAKQGAASSPTSDIQLLLHALDVGGRFLLDEVEDLDGIGHPEEDVLQVREKVCDGEAGQGGGVLAGETQRVLRLLLLGIPT